LRSTPRIRAKTAVPAILGLAATALMLDDYFGSGHGGLGAAFLGLFAVGGLGAELASGSAVLRHPRALDLAFVSGADWEWRRGHLKRRLLRTGAKLATLVLPAAAALSLWLHPPIADMLLLTAIPGSALGLGGLAVWGTMAFIRPSTMPFPEPVRTRRFGFPSWRRGAILLTARLAESLERIIPEPWATLAGRKARFLLRKEGDILAGATIAFGILGGALVVGGRMTYLIAGVLVAATLAFAWFRSESGLPDACLRAFTPLPTEARLAYQADLFLTGILAAGFLGFLIPAFLWLEGPRSLADPRCFQAIATVVLFAQLAAADNQRPGMAPNTLLVVNLGYLALAGTLFMVPAGFALAALAAALALSQAQVAAAVRTR
jgi:hypothetical protein